MKSAQVEGNYKKPRGGIITILLFWALKGLLLCGLFFVIASNIEPYSVWAMGYLSTPVTGMVSRLPLIGPLLKATYSFAGLVIWMIVQLGEVMPSLLLGSVFGLRILISAVSQEQRTGAAKMAIAPSDDELMKFLKKQFNKVNLAPINTWRRIQPIAYIIDLVILLQVFPPLKDGYSYNEILLTANFGGLDFGNVIQMLITMFAVEFVIWAWQFIDRNIYLIRRGLKG